MSYCINPNCEQRENAEGLSHCDACGTPLLIKDRYRLITRLRDAQGAQQTEIFEAVDTTGGSGVDAGTHQIMKVLAIHSIDAHEQKRVDFIWREARILKEINYPGIPKVQEDGFFNIRKTDACPELIGLVQQKIEGQTLDQWLEVNEPISEGQAIDWLKQLSYCLHEIHQRGYFHRDIKPANIILKPDGQLVLIDFGAVREVTATFLVKVSLPPNQRHYDGALEVTNIFTTGYAPPEQVMGKGIPQSDFFALGCTIVHLLTGVHPRNLPADMDSGKLLWRDQAKVSKPLANFLDTLMAIAPGKRPQNTASLLNYLQSSLPRKLRVYKLRRDRRFQFGVAIGTILLLIGGYNVGSKWASDYYFNKGSQHLFADEYEKARADLERAIQLNPKNIDAYNNLAPTCQNLGDDECAFRSYKKVLELDPSNWVTYSQLGGYFDYRDQNDEAAKYYRKAIEVGGDNAVEAYNNLARIQVLQGKYQEAIQLSTKAIDISQAVIKQTKEAPDAPAAGYKNRGWAKLELQQYDQALIDLKKSEELGYQQADTYCLLARIYDVLKDKAQSKLYWEICLTRPYNSPEVYEWKTEIFNKLYDSK